MTWEYVTGFFDGEGCIYTKGNIIRLSFSQKKNLEVLQKIEQFLRAEDIEAHLYISINHTHQLRVAKQREVKLCLEKMRPYMIVYKEKTDVALKYLSTHKFRSNFTLSEKRKIKELWLSGKKPREIAGILNAKIRTIQSICGSGQSLGAGLRKVEHKEWV